MEDLIKKMKSLIPVSLKMQVSVIPSDYELYVMNVQEFSFYTTEAVGISILFAYIFYRSAYALIFLLPILIIFFLIKKQEDCKRKRKAELAIQFRELMSAIIAGLQAGYSIENAFVSSHAEMVMLFGKNAYISREVGAMAAKVRNNATIEDVLEDFGTRSHLGDIKDFAEVFRIAKRSGGDMPGIIRQTGDIIGQKLEVKRRIETVVSAKKLEQSIMNLVPFGIILYVDATTPGFFNELYFNITGILIMTVLLIVYIVAYMWASKITDISI